MSRRAGPLAVAAEFAPAKINLYLHVEPRGADGYHPIESWMAFADIGDEIRLESAAEAAFSACGPFAGQLGREDANLVVKARDLFFEGREAAPFRLVLDKRLPVAAGLGGGSADAAAVLRLLARQRGPAPSRGLAPLAEALGADAPACLVARGTMARGRGERLSSAPAAPRLPAVLVNPGVACPTGEVFARFDRAPPPALGVAPGPLAFGAAGQVAAWLAARRNDLEPAALGLAPVIGQVLEALRSRPECLLARMSGSGTTCFGLVVDQADARRMAKVLARAYPAWWVRACTLG